MNNMDYRSAKPVKVGLRTHTFVFTIADMEHGSGNDTINDFCEKHNVLSVVFSESKGKLVYVLIYKD